MRWFLATALVLITLPSVVAQQMYRWVDKSGRVHYTQHPPDDKSATKVDRPKIGGSTVQASTVPFALQQAMKNFPVTLFTSPTCKLGCPEARELLIKRGVPFREVSVNDDPTNELLKSKTGSSKVPTFLIGTQVHVGYEVGGIGTLLDSAGYPRTASFTGKPPTLPPLEGMPAPEATPAQAPSDKTSAQP